MVEKQAGGGGDDEAREISLEVDFPIVGIGASAGGLDAFKRFFAKLPTDSGAAFVLVPHLDPTHDSLMVEILGRLTTMPVREAQDGQAIVPNCIYIIPPNRYLAIARGKLWLSPLQELLGAPTAIDFFFVSLATSQRERAVGIILSGTSNHGTVGLKEIKLYGGMVMVQQPRTAEYEQMPRNAIATGLVDFVLAPEEMPGELLKYLRHPYVRGAAEPTLEEVSREQLNRILAMLRGGTKYDFGSYRKAMLMRRIMRRMGLRHLEQLSDYADYLRGNPDELQALYKDLLIGVTDFFRDPAAFQVLEQRVIPELVARATGSARQEADSPEQIPARAQVRVWVPACATGEEAYSIAILLIEQFSLAEKPADIQIFATDIDERSLETARQGSYSESCFANVSTERLHRFFAKVDADHWQVNKQLRELITFAPQNLISDAPFSKLDLISCRNLLIYLEPSVQAQVLRLFHFALGEGGFLLLGPSESLGREAELFEAVSNKWRLFRRVGPTRRELVTFPIVALDERRQRRAKPLETPTASAGGYKELMQRLILEELAPAAALINARHEILSVAGPLVNYLEFPLGEISKDLLAMARPGLRTKIRAAVYQANKSGETVVDLHGRVKRSGAYYACSITVKPLGELNKTDRLLLVTFQDIAPSGGAATSNASSAVASGPTDEALVQHLESELAATREELQRTMEEHEASTAELQASSEEIMSMNEELQSANEELETSKEELQSLNEELTTVNSQLQEKVEELDRSNADLKNLMHCSEVAVVFLDEQLKIKRFTPAVEELLNLRATDVDRPIGDFAPKFVDDTLLTDCREVLEKLVPLEKAIWTIGEPRPRAGRAPEPLVRGERRGGGGSSSPSAKSDTAPSRCFLRRILPYRAKNNRVEGVVLTFTDITFRIEAEIQSLRMATVLRDSNDAVTVQDLEGRIIAWNHAAERIYGYTEDEALRLNIGALVPTDRQTEIPEYAQRAARGAVASSTFETQRIAKDGQIVEIELTLTPYREEHGAVIGVATTERDIRERKRSLQALYEQSEQMQAILNTANDAIITISHDGNIVKANPAATRMFGYEVHELVGQNVRNLMPSPFQEEHDGYIATYLRTGEPRMIGIGREVVALRRDGSLFPVELSVNRVDHFGLFTGFIRDISWRRKLQQQVLEIAAEERQRIGQELHDGTGQELTSLALFASALVDLLKNLPKPAAEPSQGMLLASNDLARLEQTAARLLRALDESNLHVQQLSHGIMPVHVEPEGFRSALEQLVASTHELPNIACSLDYDVTIEIADNATATHLYRIAQEAVNNAVRHSKADAIRIIVRQTRIAVILEVSDNGTGFDVISDKSKKSDGPQYRHGIDIMNYRASAIGGTLRITRQPTGGMLMQCMLFRGSVSN